MATRTRQAGHSDFKTTQGYIDLGGETLREEAELLDARLFGRKAARSNSLVAKFDNGEPRRGGLFAANGQIRGGGGGI